MILKKAWAKKIQVEDKPIQFDHDYPAEIVQHRRSYAGIKKVLKENGIRFQTPYTKIRIFWKEGTRSYNNANDAAQELKIKGLNINLPEQSGGDESSTKATGWQRVDGGRSTLETGQRAREKLRGFQRP
ncbi:hypothetical protein WMY93_015040 [Mugilogobius chulae]|uniref:Transposase n=1 Tax=Mugilogobius chulae TaxID=88201 RepID=A0AAW0P0M8_9GOBI